MYTCNVGMRSMGAQLCGFSRWWGRVSDQGSGFQFQTQTVRGTNQWPVGLRQNQLLRAFVTFFRHIQERYRCLRSWLQSTEPAKRSRPPRLRSSFPRLVDLDDKPTLCVFTPVAKQSKYCITLNYHCATLAHIF